MTKQSWRVVGWCVLGLIAGRIAILGAFDRLYWIFSNEPLTLALGLGLTVISLYGLVDSARRGPQWCLVPATVTAVIVVLGLITDITVLALGLTISGFYS